MSAQDRPSHTRAPDRGAALLSVLLLVTIMSVLALGVTEITTRAIDRAKLGDARMRLSWQTTGAEELGTALITRADREVSGAFTDLFPGFLEPLSFAPPGGGFIELQIVDASNCFNLNALALRGDAEEPGALEARRAAYMDLLTALAFAPTEAEALADAVIDWVDLDGEPRLAGAEDPTYLRAQPPYRTSGQPLYDLSELKAIVGYTPEVLQRLQRFVCALPTSDEVALNINTLEPDDAALLSMTYSGLIGVEFARTLLEQRPRGGWADVADLESIEEIKEISTDFRRSQLLSVRSSFLETEGYAQFQDGFRTFNTLYALGDAGRGAQIVRRNYGER